MKEELERKLQEAFPFMQRSKAKGKGNAYQQWGCQCDDGWYVILCSLCQKITDRYAQDNEQPIDDLVVQQVKEKFGALKFYYSYKDAPRFAQNLDSLSGRSGIRLQSQTDDTNNRKMKLREDIKQIVRDFESKSTHVCELCGDKGEIRKMSWQRTLCDNCYSEHIKRRENQKRHSENHIVK